jgi:hypothetical protein
MLCGRLACARCASPFTCPSGEPFRLRLDGVSCTSVDAAGDYAMGVTRWGGFRVLDLKGGRTLRVGPRLAASSWPRVVSGGRVVGVETGASGGYRALELRSAEPGSAKRLVSEDPAPRARRLVVSSDDGVAIVLLGDRCEIEVLDLRSERRVGRYREPTEITALDASAEAGLIACAGFGWVALRDLSTGKVAAELAVGSCEIRWLALAGRRIAVLTGDGELRVGEVAGPGPTSLRSVRLPARKARAGFNAYGFRLEREVGLPGQTRAAFSRDSELLALETAQGQLVVSSLSDEKPPLELELPGKELTCLRFVRSGALLAATRETLSCYPRRSLAEGTAAVAAFPVLGLR